MPDPTAGDGEVASDKGFILFTCHEELLVVCACGGGGWQLTAHGQRAALPVPPQALLARH